MKSYKKLLRAILFLIPLICGFTGLYVVERESLPNTLFWCVLMYVLNYTLAPPNILVEIARWTAPLASAYGIFMIVSTLSKSLRDQLRSRRPDSVAVYGPESEKPAVLEALGRTGVDGGNAPSPAKRHILLWDEDENLSFYHQYREAFKDKDVYLKCASVPAQAAAGTELHLFCPEETAARLYWKEEPLYETSCACGHRMDVVFIGFGKLGSELLSYAIQNNIFSPDQRIGYHVFGGDASYLKIHRSLNELQDQVVFHEDQWLDCLPLLEGAGRVIVLQQYGQTELLSHLLLALRRQRIDVFSDNNAGLEIMDSRDRLCCFPWKDIAYRPENIMGDELFRRAKAINLRYAHIYSGVPETTEESENEWKKLDSFTRYSNVSSADYHDIRLKMLDAMGETDDPEKIAPEHMELLSELEHMRWCRYHLLNNWSFGDPENGKNKDAAKRIHSDLKPYDQLSEEEKQKDRDTIRILLELGRSEKHQ